ncbi:MAG: nuclease-related domain-containing protein [Solirubrobacterales bacterium]
MHGSAPVRPSSLRRRGRLVTVLEALSADSLHEARWARRAESEERARRLEALLAGSGVRLLNDRRVPGARATIDHLAIGPRGVTVIDAVRERGRARIVEGRLLVNGEDRTSLVRDVLRQVEVIRLGLSASPNLPIGGAICWVEHNGLPRVRQLSLDDVLIDRPHVLAEELRRPGSVSLQRVRHLTALLDRRLPARD